MEHYAGAWRLCSILHWRISRILRDLLRWIHCPDLSRLLRVCPIALGYGLPPCIMIAIVVQSFYSKAACRMSIATIWVSKESQNCFNSRLIARHMHKPVSVPIVPDRRRD